MLVPDMTQSKTDYQRFYFLMLTTLATGWTQKNEAKKFTNLFNHHFRKKMLQSDLLQILK